MKTLKILLGFFPTFLFGQQITTMTGLVTELNETSALIYVDGRIITLNDSGGEPALYEVDSLTGDISRTVTISNASNIDWESLCFNSDYIFIGDFGNNDGSRQDLKIYRISMSDYLNNNTVVAEMIKFKYADQYSFSPSPFATNFDAEASVYMNDSIYIFTKNWVDNLSNVYVVPAKPGEYVARRAATMHPQGLVTGASLNPGGQSMIITGYTQTLAAFVAQVEIGTVQNGSLSFSVLEHPSLLFPAGYSKQLEGVCYVGQDYYYLSAEKNLAGNAVIYKLHMPEPAIQGNSNNNAGVLNNEMMKVRVYPNPATSIIQISTLLPAKLIITDSNGKIVWQSDEIVSNVAAVDVSTWRSGIYMINAEKEGELHNQALIIQ